MLRVLSYLILLARGLWPRKEYEKNHKDNKTIKAVEKKRAAKSLNCRSGFSARLTNK